MKHENILYYDDINKMELKYSAAIRFWQSSIGVSLPLSLEIVESDSLNDFMIGAREAASKLSFNSMPSKLLVITTLRGNDSELARDFLSLLSEEYEISLEPILNMIAWDNVEFYMGTTALFKKEIENCGKQKRYHLILIACY